MSKGKIQNARRKPTVLVTEEDTTATTTSYFGRLLLDRIGSNGNFDYVYDFRNRLSEVYAVENEGKGVLPLNARDLGTARDRILRTTGGSPLVHVQRTGVAPPWFHDRVWRSG